MRLFGDLLPFVGFRVRNVVDADGDPTDDKTDWAGDCFELEWLGVGVCLYVGKVWRDEPF